MNTRRIVAATTCLLITLAVAVPSFAQGLGGFIRDRAKERVKQKIAECIATDLECIRRAQAAGQEVKISQPAAPAAPATAPASASGSAESTSTARGAAALKPGEGAWVNYDFKPGERPLFVEDFTKDEVGNFPRRLELVDGNMEVAEWNGGRYLRMTTWPGTFKIVLPEELPERFSLEFDTTAPLHQNWMILRFAEKTPHDVRLRIIGGNKGSGGVFGGTHQAGGTTPEALEGVFKARVMADGKYVKVYINETRIANVPNADLGRSKTITFEVPAKDTEPVLISNISIMAGGRKLYDALSETGRVATQGIYFDTGSDRIRPESTPTLKEIGEMLKEHADLKLTIEGHTDNVGNAAANQALAEKRAAAVKAFLVGSYGVDASRLQTAGFGDQKPVAPNTTPEGRQQNRRVELVKG